VGYKYKSRLFLLRVLRRECWGDVLKEAEEKLESSLEGDNLTAALSSLYAMSSSANSRGRGDLAKSLYKQMNEEVFKKVLLEQLGLHDIGYQDKFGRFDLKLLLPIQNAVLKYIAPAILDLQRAARGTIFDRIPISVYFAFFIVSMYDKRVCSPRFFRTNQDKFYRLAMKLWPTVLEDSEKASMKAGTTLFMLTLMFINVRIGLSNSIDTIIDKFHTAQKRWRHELLGREPEYDDTELVHNTAEEEETLLQSIRTLSNRIGASMSLQSRLRNREIPLISSSKDADAVKLAERTARDTENGPETAVTIAQLVIQGADVISSCYESICQFRNDENMHKTLDEIHLSTGEDTEHGSKYAGAFAVLLKAGLVFHDYGGEYAQCIDFKKVVAGFIERMDPEDAYALIQPRKLKKRQNEQQQAQKSANTAPAPVWNPEEGVEEESDEDMDVTE